MRVNYTMMNAGLTGGVRVLLEVANRLADRGHDVTVTTMGAPGDHAWFQERFRFVHADSFVADRAVAASDRFLRTSLRTPRAVRRLARKAPDCDINVATFCLTAQAVLDSGKGAPFFHMQHDETLFFPPGPLQDLARQAYRLPLRKICNSLWLKDRLVAQGLLDPQAPVVNPGIDTSVFHPRPRRGGTDRLRVLCFAKAVDWKGWGEAAAALHALTRGRRDVEVHAFGAALPPVPEGLDVVFHRWPSDDELAQLYSDMDLVVCPSWYESFPLPPLEAMACGAPVVATRFGTEDYAEHGRNAYVVPGKDPVALREGIEAVLADGALRERFRREGPRTAARFTYDATCDKVEALFEAAA